MKGSGEWCVFTMKMITKTVKNSIEFSVSLPLIFGTPYPYGKMMIEIRVPATDNIVEILVPLKLAVQENA